MIFLIYPSWPSQLIRLVVGVGVGQLGDDDVVFPVRSASGGLSFFFRTRVLASDGPDKKKKRFGARVTMALYGAWLVLALAHTTSSSSVPRDLGTDTGSRTTPFRP